MKAKVKVLFDLKSKTFMNVEWGKLVPTNVPKVYRPDISPANTTIMLIGEWPENVVFVDAIVTIENYNQNAGTTEK